MKVSELIEELNKQDPDALVVVDGCEGGYEDIYFVDRLGIELDPYRSSWDSTYIKGEAIQAVYLPRVPCDD